MVVVSGFLILLLDHVALGGTAYLIDSPEGTGPLGSGFVLPRLLTINTLHNFLTQKSGPLYALPECEVMGFINSNNKHESDSGSDLNKQYKKEDLFLISRIKKKRHTKDFFLHFRYNNDSLDWPDIQLFLASYADNTDGGLFGKRDNGLTDEYYAAVYEPILYKDAFSILPLLMRPRSRGKIRLQSSDPNKYPLIYPNYFEDPHDLDVLYLYAEIETFVFKRVVSEEVFLIIHDFVQQLQTSSSLDQLIFQVSCDVKLAVIDLNTFCYPLNHHHEQFVKIAVGEQRYG
ncbi:unnamed protein product [Timema podura]|uniref:Glucose-methanol-choline oxidoreductase C-terminal domain-containing protein n=1 Tax=Timema podura TaxID=61482 RepID=A0ABN7NQ31_TIMPD|nr:unnamed protein product [Timema podura]